MTVNELYKGVSLRSDLRVIHAGTGKILCYQYKPESPKHEKIGRMEILDLWANIQVANGIFGDYAKPYLCVFAAEREE